LPENNLGNRYRKVPSEHLKGKIAMGRSTYLSVVIPIYNEEENVSLLQASIRQALQDQNYSYEVIYVDDGSTDGTFQRLRDIVERDHHVHIIKLRRNFGQTAAISAGVAHSSGEILIFMDGDLQNDPKDIVRLLAKIDEGYDVVSGWRKNRKDAHLSRKLPSWLANRLISKVTGVFLHDYGCTLKAYRREIFQHIRLYGEMHRFIPAYAAISGARIAEIEVEHHSRRFGKSKYGISRTARVILDLATVKFLGSFSTKPNYAFGIPGLIALTIGGMLGGALVVRKVLPPHVRIHRNPLLPISLHLSGFGIQCILMGLLAELLTRTYHESQGKPIFVVSDILSTCQSGMEDSESVDEVLTALR